MKTNVDELLEAVARAGGAIELHRLSADALAALPFVDRLQQVTCESCRVVLVANGRRRFCLACGRERENRAQWRREQARRRPRRP